MLDTVVSNDVEGVFFSGSYAKREANLSYGEGGTILLNH